MRSVTPCVISMRKLYSVEILCAFAVKIAYIYAQRATDDGLRYSRRRSYNVSVADGVGSGM